MGRGSKNKIRDSRRTHAVRREPLNNEESAMAGAHDTHAAHAAHDHTPRGWRRFVYSTNHKDIGTMYLIFAICAGVIGGFLSVMMRAELMYPGMQIFGDPHTFNVFVTGHGLI